MLSTAPLRPCGPAFRATPRARAAVDIPVGTPPPCRPMFAEEVEIHEVAERVWNAPFAVLAHDIEASSEAGGQGGRGCAGVGVGGVGGLQVSWAWVEMPRAAHTGCRCSRHAAQLTQGEPSVRGGAGTQYGAPLPPAGRPCSSVPSCGRARHTASALRPRRQGLPLSACRRASPTDFATATRRLWSCLSARERWSSPQGRSRGPAHQGRPAGSHTGATGCS